MTERSTVPGEGCWPGLVAVVAPRLAIYAVFATLHHHYFSNRIPFCRQMKYQLVHDDDEGDTTAAALPSDVAKIPSLSEGGRDPDGATTRTDGWMTGRVMRL